MIRFFCQCGTEVFFDNNYCSACGSALGFNPASQQLFNIKSDGRGLWVGSKKREQFKLCSMNYNISCNWLIPKTDENRLCLSCRVTRTIPTLAIAKNGLRWRRLEQTKRRAFYMLLRLGLSIGGSSSALKPPVRLPPLLFDFLEDRRSNPNVAEEFVYSGHNNGIITLNAAEADESFRSANKEMMNELYRTLLGHFRHELGHYYFLMLDDSELSRFRQRFGNEKEDYQAAIDLYYSEGAKAGWRDYYISAYASSHPLEDWAETWSHYLHIRDTLETAKAYGIFTAVSKTDLRGEITLWAELSVIMNALNRSMGVDDAYPFVITPAVVEKLEFIDNLVSAWRASGHSAARQ